jgi:hypothetical protein
MMLLEGISAWQEFTIIPGVEPVVKNFQPFYGLLFEMSDPNSVLIIQGTYFFEESEFVLVRKRNNFDWSGINLEGRNDVIFPNRVILGDNMASLSFTRGALRQGNYEIFIRNPGGLWTCFGEVRVGFRNRTDFTFSFGYSPMFAAFDIQNAWKEDFMLDNIGGFYFYRQQFIQELDRFNLQGMYFRFSWIPVKTTIGNFGLEAQVYFLTDNYDKIIRERKNSSGFSQLMDTMKEGSINLLYQLPVLERWQHNIRFGAGFGYPYHTYTDFFIYNDLSPFLGYPFIYKQHIYQKEVVPLMLNLGYSVQYFLWKNLYLEAGLDIQYVFSISVDQSLRHWIFRPGIGIGWQMGRWAEYAEVAEGARKGEDYSVPVLQTPKAEHLLSVGWSPYISLFGFERYGLQRFQRMLYSSNKIIDEPYYVRNNIKYADPVNLLGLNLRYAYLPYRWGKNKFGFDFELNLLFQGNQDKIDNKLLDIVSEALIGFRYQRILNDDWQMNFRVGAGIANSYDYMTETRYVFPGITVIDGASSRHHFALDMGVSAQYFFWNNAYIEAGIDSIIIFKDGKNSAALRPGIAIGWQFNRNNETGLRLPGTGLPFNVNIAPPESQEP